jgi:hypothetical protein
MIVTRPARESLLSPVSVRGRLREEVTIRCAFAQHDFPAPALGVAELSSRPSRTRNIHRFRATDGGDGTCRDHAPTPAVLVYTRAPSRSVSVLRRCLDRRKSGQLPLPH